MTRLHAQQLFEGRGEVDGDCHVWTGGRAGKGYGVVAIDGRSVYTHRLSLELKLGRRLRPGEQSLHRCDNPPCFRQDHLFAGTQADNLADAGRKGHMARVGAGGDWGQAKKTHCPQGHPYDEENTYRYQGERQCRACRRAAARRYKERGKI